MDSGFLSLKKEKSFPKTFFRFCPDKKKEINGQLQENPWNFVINDDNKTIRASRKNSVSKTRCCKVTDSIYKQDVCNSEIYRKTGLQQNVLNTLDGISTNVVICGPHKTGKTHLLIGSQRSIGLVLQSIYDLFAAIRCYSNGIHLNEKELNTEIGGNFDRFFVVKASVLEIGENSSDFKLDNVRDLINPENPLQLIRKLGGELGYLIKGEPEHLFENEEKLVASILSAVSRKKVLDALRRERLAARVKKNKIPEVIQNTLFGDFGEKWIKDDILGSLMITITVESVDRSELENNIRKNEKLINSIHVNNGSIRFFEISSCLSTSKNIQNVVPMFGLLDLAFEIRKYCYTNEKSNRIDITNISGCVASNIIDSNLIVIGTLSPFPNEKKCCIRPIMIPYDNNSNVQPHSIFDTLQFIEYIGNSMKFPIYPQRNCFKKPFSQSKLIDICRKTIIKDQKKSINDRFIIKSDRGLWQTESSARVTRIIRLLTFINRTVEGSGVLRILMSANDDDILRIYCEDIIGSDKINIDNYKIVGMAGKWFQNETFKFPEQESKKNFLYNYPGKKNEELLNIKKDKISDHFRKKTDYEELDPESIQKSDINDSRIKNLDYSEKTSKDEKRFKNILWKNHHNSNPELNLRYDEILLSKENIERETYTEESDNFDEEKNKIFDSEISKNPIVKKNINDQNLNSFQKMGEKNRRNCNVDLADNEFKNNFQELYIVDKAIGENHKLNNFIDENVLRNHESNNMINESVGKSQTSFDFIDIGVGKSQKFSDFVDAEVGKSQKSLDFADIGVGKSQKSLDFADIGVGKSQKSLDFADIGVGKSQKSLNFADIGVGKSQKSLNFADIGVGKSQKSLDFADIGVGKSQKSLDFADNEIDDSHLPAEFTENEIDEYSDSFDPAREYEELLKKTISLNKLQKSIMEKHKKHFQEDLNNDQNSDTYISQFENKHNKNKYYPLVNKKALEASKKAIEASKKAIEASKGFYKSEIKHTRGKVHEVIPASKNFPQVDIYAPSYNSDAEYDFYQNPKDFFFNKSNLNKEENFVLNNPNFSEKKCKYDSVKNIESCPCCDFLSKNNKCRCHYKDASVNFVGLNEASVNTDNSFLDLYKPGIGFNERIKLNGRSWDVFINTPRDLKKVTVLGFKNKIEDLKESDLKYELTSEESGSDYLNSPIKNTIQENVDKTQTNSDFAMDKIFNTDNEFPYSNKSSENIYNKSYNKSYNNLSNYDVVNLTKDNEIREIKPTKFDKIKLGNSKNLNSNFLVNLSAFKPLYDQNKFKKEYRIFNRTNKKKIFEEDLSEKKSIFKNSDFLTKLNIQNKNNNRTSQAENKNNYANHSFLNNYEVEENPDFESDTNYIEKYNLSESFDALNSENHKWQNYNTFDTQLEEMEKDVSKETHSFKNFLKKDHQKNCIPNSIPNYSNNFNLENQCSKSNFYLNLNKTNLNEQKILMKNITKEANCCGVKYIITFPEELRPKVMKGTNSYKFPYLKSLY